MKKIIPLLLAVALLATLTACGKKNADSGNNTTSSTEQVTTTTTNWADGVDDSLFNDAELEW